jgi:hypothetical protein
MFAESSGQIPVDYADRAARVTLQVLREGRPANDPHELAVPVKPNR